MALQEILEIATSVILSLGGGGALVFGLSNYLGKVWADRALEKQRHELGLMTEQVKNSLQIAALEHQVRFSKLHEKRAEVIENAYGRLVDARQQGKRFIVSDAYISDPVKRQEARGQDRGRDERALFVYRQASDISARRRLRSAAKYLRRYVASARNSRCLHTTRTANA
jgi:hypothetical protein